MGRGYVDMQRERLQQLAVGWLELEMSAPPFEVKLSEKSSRMCGWGRCG